jgi:D-threo-aldose 1-dehydrogenase
MTALRSNSLGSTGIVVSEVCVGTSPLGGNAGIYGHDVSEADAIATVTRALETPIPFIDTSNEYGGGQSEVRIGRALAAHPPVPALVIATKSDPLPGGRFDAARVRESFDESISRLGVDRVDLFYLHDPERFAFAEMTAAGGAVEGMRSLLEEDRVGAIGVAGGDLDEMRRYVDTEAFSVLRNHNHFTVLDRSGDALIDHALRAGVAFVNAAPYASGMLAKPVEARPRYQYREPDAEIVDLTARLRELCASFGTDLAAAALQFSTRDPRVSSTVVGVSRPERVDQLVQNAMVEIPEDLWPAIDELVAP